MTDSRRMRTDPRVEEAVQKGAEALHVLRVGFLNARPPAPYVDQSRSRSVIAAIGYEALLARLDEAEQERDEAIELLRYASGPDSRWSPGWWQGKRDELLRRES